MRGVSVSVVRALVLVGLVGAGVMALMTQGGSSSGERAVAAPLLATNGNGSSSGSNSNDSSNNSNDSSNNANSDNGNNGNGGEVIVLTATPTATPKPGPAPAPAPAPAPPPPAPVAQGPCSFQLGFAFLHSVLNGVDGNCVANEQPNPANGDSLQPTQNGLMVYQKSTNTMRWTNGFRTSTYSQCGLQQRLNTQTFAWEANPALLASAGPGSPACNLVG